VVGSGDQAQSATPNARATGPSQWEGIPGWLPVAAVAIVVALVLVYMFGIPMLADALAHRLPAGLTTHLGDQALAALDQQVFAPSAIPRDRQHAIDAAFGRLRMPPGTIGTYGLEFRKSDPIGANAMALPSGTIVVTDDLITLAHEDSEILGVLAHEAGHVEHRHGLRGMLQNSLLSLALAWIVGDMSSIAAAAPAALLEANYSRDLEREADAFAIRVLDANDIPRAHLVDMLRRLETSAKASGIAGGLKYLSTHPATAERIQWIEKR
jgi:Zn-dependent protease with chaperone function